VLFFIYCRDRPGTEELRPRLAEAHWAYMDPYEGQMVARGPTLADDGERMTGSLHIVDLPDPATARRYAVEEPFHLAGVYEAVDLLAWDDALGRTMWQHASTADDPVRFLGIGHAAPAAGEPESSVVERQLAAWREAPGLIAAGGLRSPEDGGWRGVAVLAELPDSESVRQMLDVGPIGRAGHLGEVEVHRWRFGGRPPAGAGSSPT
jgi:uncharacterized protein YciI